MYILCLLETTKNDQESEIILSWIVWQENTVTGKLQMNKNPINATVWVDGNKTGAQKKDVCDGPTLTSYSKAPNHLRQI